MTSDDVASDSTPAPAPLVVTPVPQPARPVQSLARRLSSRTTDLLAVAIVLVGSLTLGRQMLEWWQADPPEVLDIGPIEDVSTEWGANDRPVSLEFGDSPISMTRQVISTGGSPAAFEIVVQRCQEFLVKAEPPQAAPDAAELDQLASLKNLKPRVEQPGKWELFTISGRMAMVIGVKQFPHAKKSDPASPSKTRRVICWGLVFPGLGDTWTAYTFVRRPTGAARHESTAELELSRLQLPAGCGRTVLMQEAGQTGLLGFEGPFKPGEWQQHFGESLSQQGWVASNPWQQLPNGWSARFVKQARSGTGGEDSTIEIQLHPQKDGRGIGLIHWLPGRASRTAETENARGTP